MYVYIYKTVFGNTKTVLALKQPPNLLRHLTKAEFLSNQFLHNSTLTNGLFRFECNDARMLCLLYKQECNSFITANGLRWHIK